MTIHLTWMTPVWILAGIGAAFLLYVIVGAILMLFFLHD